MPDTATEWLRRRDQVEIKLAASPYNAGIYLERAQCHNALGYPDLAASDAYRALLLTDEASFEDGEYHDRALQAIKTSSITANILEEEYAQALGSCNGGLEPGEDGLRSRFPELESTVGLYSRQAYASLVRALIECRDLNSAWSFADRGCKTFETDKTLQDLRNQAIEIYYERREGESPQKIALDFVPMKDLPHNGYARREIYPWNTHEPDRFSQSVLNLLNIEMAKIAPKCEVRAVELPLLSPPSTASTKTKPILLKQLGIFAKENIAPDETILHEPSILTANNRLHDPLCDACSAPFPGASLAKPLPTCPDCDDIVFCSPSCLLRAQELYHPAVCGQEDFDIGARDPSPKAATSALYLLLLARTIAMAETQNLHPLELWEIKHLWGEFTSPSAALPHAPLLPFDFQTNIAAPIHMLEKLDMDIYKPETVNRYDTWVINTLMAKYRGVASAKMNPRTGMPEVCAVHWRWSLANHSCAPNVKWEWPARGAGPAGFSAEDGSNKEEAEGGGCMGLIARGGQDVVQWGNDDARHGGIKKGEEVLNHYCDIELPVQKRREWAQGALGGMCMCARCIEEAASSDESHVDGRV